MVREQVGHRIGVIALDGKGLQGIHSEELPGVHGLSVSMDEVGFVLVQGGGSNEHEGELLAALGIPATLPQVRL